MPTGVQELVGLLHRYASSGWKLGLPVCGQSDLGALSYIFLSVTCYTVLGPNAYVNTRLGFMASSAEQECPGLYSSPQERERVREKHSAATGQSSAIP